MTSRFFRNGPNPQITQISKHKADDLSVSIVSTYLTPYNSFFFALNVSCFNRCNLRNLRIWFALIVDPSDIS